MCSVSAPAGRVPAATSAALQVAGVPKQSAKFQRSERCNVVGGSCYGWLVDKKSRGKQKFRCQSGRSASGPGPCLGPGRGLIHGGGRVPFA